MDNGADISSLPQVQIRDGLPADAPTIFALSDETHRLHRARLPDKFAPKNDYQHWLIARALAETPPSVSILGTKLRVAHDGDDMLGYVLLVWDTPKDDQETVQAVIADIAVVEGARQQGIAQALLRDADAQRVHNNWHSLTADVWLNNDPSHALFKKAGFVAVRSEYILGEPPDLKETPIEPENSSATWWIVAACVVVGLVIGISL